jgi:hypothetical protein
LSHVDGPLSLAAYALAASSGESSLELSVSSCLAAVKVLRAGLARGVLTPELSMLRGGADSVESDSYPDGTL